MVKYLDAVETFIDELKQLCDRHSLECKQELKANDNGYYAAHFYVRETIDFALVRGEIKTANMWIELQVTTQLQEILRQFSHTFYEKLRMTSSVKTEVPWQWRYKDDEFFAIYLGHMLHNIEGMIMEVRRRQEVKNASV